MTIDLNFLKIAGAFVAGLAGIIGILGQTRTPDNKLTRSGKWLFGMAIVGVVLAMSTQIWEWRKTIDEDRDARERNRTLLEQLKSESTNIRRAVTRFQTISFFWSCTFDSSNKVFGPYIQELEKIIEEERSKPSSSGFEQSHRGIQQLAESNPFSFRIEADSPAMPDELKYPCLREYILEAVPEVRLFKTRIKPENFVLMPPSVLTEEHDARKGDLVLNLTPGKVYIELNISNGPKVPTTIRVVHSDMNVSVQFTSGYIISLEDLSGSQAIIYLPPRKEFEEPWSTASSHWLNCKINDQLIVVSSEIPLKVGPRATLISTQTHGRNMLQPIYSFTFPETAPATVNH
jgi:hypothetical protein